MIFLQEAYLMWSFLGELNSAFQISEFSQANECGVFFFDGSSSHVLTRYVELSPWIDDKSQIPQKIRSTWPPPKNQFTSLAIISSCCCCCCCWSINFASWDQGNTSTLLPSFIRRRPFWTRVSTSHQYLHIYVHINMYTHTLYFIYHRRCVSY